MSTDGEMIDREGIAKMLGISSDVLRKRAEILDGYPSTKQRRPARWERREVERFFNLTPRQSAPSDALAQPHKAPVPVESAPLAQQTTALYRHFDEEGVLLYVGISVSPISRLEAHLGRSSWVGRICKVTIERHRTRSDAEIAERTAIETERPMHNIRHAVRAGSP
jgi:hypothetical protein